MLERFERALRQVLQEEIDRETEGLVSGAPGDFAEYSKRVGRIEGLKKALEYAMDQARTDTFKD